MKNLLLILTKNTTMKRLLLILLCLPMIFTDSYAQSSFVTNSGIGTFDYVNGVSYRAIFNEDLDIKSQIIKIKANVTLIGYPMRSAKMEVEKKEGRTRITVTNFDIGDVSSSGAVIVGNVVMGGDDTEYYKMDNVVWNEKKQMFRKSFVTKYSKKLEDSILLAIERLHNANSSDDDW